MSKASVIHSHRPARGFVPLNMKMADVAQYAALAGMGININNRFVQQAMEGCGFDANDVGIAPAPMVTLTTASIATQIQFLQNWLPGFVTVMTAARKIDLLIGISTSGAWEDEEIVQGILERAGTAKPYGDTTNVPLASWNANWERRTVVRFEQGISVATLEELRSARMRVNTAAEKRTGAAASLDVQRNRVGFFGYNDGSGRTFGFLNDPSLPAYGTLPNGAAGSPTWATKTFMEMQTDLILSLRSLRVQSLDNIDPKTTPITLAIAMSAVDYMSSTQTTSGQSVLQWLKEAYPNVRVESAPELDAANGGANVFYLFAESVQDGSTDNSRTFEQIVPSKFMALGVEKRAKSYLEDYSNATAGVLCKRPYAVVRKTGC